MKLLAIDTATEACSAALLVGEDLVVRYEEAPRQHAQMILSMVDELLAEAEMMLSDLDAIAVGQGPGSFTGVRIGLSAAQGLALGSDLGLIGISDLASVAQRVVNKHHVEYVAVAFDARMDEVYWGCYSKNEDGLVELLGDETVCAPGKVSLPVENVDWSGGGRGWAAYATRLNSPVIDSVQVVDDECLPSAETIARLAVVESPRAPEEVLPVYLRNTVAWKKKSA